MFPMFPRRKVDLAGLDAWSRALIQPGVHEAEFVVGRAALDPITGLVGSSFQPLGFDRFLRAVAELTSRLGPTNSPKTYDAQAYPVAAWAFDGFQVTISLVLNTLVLTKHVAIPIHPEAAGEFSRTYRAWIEVANRRHLPRVVVVEPWGHDYTLQPGESFELIAEGNDSIPSFSYIDRDDFLEIHCIGAGDHEVRWNE